jgi:FkbM family methyltransferase
MSLPRFRFDISIRNTIEEPSIKAPQMATEAASSVRLRNLPFLRQLLGPVVRVCKRCVRFVQRLAFRPIDVKLDELRARVDFLLGAAHPKLDALHAKFDVVHKQTEFLQQNLDKHVHFLVQAIGDVRREVSELAVRARTPIELDASTMALRTSDGFVLVPREDPLLMLMLHDAGPTGLEPGTQSLIRKVLYPGATFVDVGAHIGLLTLVAARTVGETGRVIAIEPIPKVYQLLKRAISLNGIEPFVSMHQIACGSLKESKTFYVTNVLGHSSLYPPLSLLERSDQIDVQVVPLDHILPTGDRVELVKIDVEGAEIEVLKGMTRTITENRDLVIIAEFGPAHLRRTGISPEEWFGFFSEAGFTPLMIDELSGKCNELDMHEVLTKASLNIAFARPDSGGMVRLLS